MRYQLSIKISVITIIIEIETFIQPKILITAVTITINLEVTNRLQQRFLASQPYMLRDLK